MTDRCSCCACAWRSVFSPIVTINFSKYLINMFTLLCIRWLDVQFFFWQLHDMFDHAIEVEGATAALLQYYGTMEVRVLGCAGAVCCVTGAAVHCASQLRNARFNRLCEEKRYYDGIVRSLGIDSSTIVCVGSGFMGSSKGRGKSRITGPVKVRV